MNNNLPFISIIILNFNGKKIVHHCLDSLRKINYPKTDYEIIVVDNGSEDGSIEIIQNNYPEVRLSLNKTNLGFCVPNNNAAREAKGDYLVFLNNDMRVEADWLSELVGNITANSNIATASSKILSWDGSEIYHGGADSDIFMNARLEGYKEINKNGAYDQEKEILFPSGGSMIIKKDTFLNCGGFDEDFFAYYEDVDLGIRLKVMGYENHFVPTSIVYHMHSATSSKLPKEKLRVLQIRNILWVIIKNYGDENLQKILAPAFLLSLQRTFEFTGNFTSEKYNFLKIEKNKVKKLPLTGLYKDELLLLSDLVGYSDILVKWSKFIEKRSIIQKARKNSDQEIFKLMKSRYIPIVNNPLYAELYKDFLIFFNLIVQ